MESSLGLVFQYFFTIGVAVGFGLVVGLGIPFFIYKKIGGKSWKFSKATNNRLNR